MPLIKGLQPRSNTLTADLLRTAVSAPLTFGAHAIKGMSLGLLDPTQEVSEMLGEDIYEAAPEWARTGAEMVGEFAPIMGSLGAARRLVPGVTALPRFLQGAVAGTTLGGIRAAVEGEDIGGITKHALVEGLIFGGIEALTGIPAMVKQRQLKRLGKRTKDFLPYETATTDAAVSPEAHAVAQDAEAFRYRTAPTPATVARTQRGPLPEAQIVDQPGLLAAMEGVWTDETHGLYGQKMVLQLWEDEKIKSVEGFLRYAKKDAIIFVEHGTGKEIRLTPKKLFNQFASPEARLMRGGKLTHVIPPNMDLEYRAATKNYESLVKRLRSSGQLSKMQVDKFLEYANPKAIALNDLSHAEINMLTRLMRRGAKGLPGEKVLPDALADMIGYMGDEAMVTRAGAWSWFQPAHWFVEAMTKKMGGARWLKDVHNSFLWASQEVKKTKIFVSERFGPRGIFKGLSADQRNSIPELIYQIRRDASKYGLNTPAYRAQRLKTIADWRTANSKKWGKDASYKLQQAYSQLRSTIDQWDSELIKEGLLSLDSYQKELLPLLSAREVGLEALYPDLHKMPKQLQKFLDVAELGPAEPDLYKLIDRMVANYTKLKFMKPAQDFMKAQVHPTKGRNVHATVKSWLEHYAARQYGIPSKVDLMLAESLKTAFQKVPKGMPLLGEYAHKFGVKDWLKVSVFFNDLPYLAHLGLRPFSAMRNLLQPMLTTGPLIGNRWLAHGYHDFGMNPEARKWIKDYRLLQESLGEYEMRLSLSPRKLDQFGKFMMGLFRKSDELNRYASGLGMRAKFDHFFSKHGMTEEFLTKIKLRRFQATTRSEVRQLMRAYQAADELGRYKYPKGSPRAKELSGTIKRAVGRDFMEPTSILEKMRVKVVADAIGNTQWLYGKEHAPIFTHAAGFPGRQIGVYQTWWLNYFEFMKHNIFTLPKKIGESRDFGPQIVWAANNMAITLGLIGLGWEAKKITRTIALGPFPAELPDPPGLQPFFHLGNAFGNTFFRGDIKAAEKNMATALRRAWDNWVPGSLVYKEMAKVGWTPQLRVSDVRLTPKARLSDLSIGAKLASVAGGRGRGE